MNSIIKPTTAYPTGANWPSASSRGYQTDQVALCVDTVADVNDNDFERVRFVFVKSKASFYRLDLSSGAADDADTVLLDNQGRRYIKIVGSAGTLSWDALAEDITARGAYDDEAEGFTVLVIDSGDGRSAVYVMGDGGSADWSDPIYVTSRDGKGAGFPFTFDGASQTMADPGPGIFRLNDATPEDATAIALPADLASADDLSAAVVSLMGSDSSVKAVITIAWGAASWLRFEATAISDNTSWLQITVQNGTIGGTLSDEQDVELIIDRTGDKGDTGAAITPQGAYDGGTTYTTGALVSYSGRAFISSQDGNVGNTPPTSDTDSAYWMFLPGGLYGGIPSPNDYGATGDGSTDDRAAFVALDAAGVTNFLVPPGKTYKIGSNLTLAAKPDFRGGVIKPADGITVTLSAGYHCGDTSQCFDCSDGTGTGAIAVGAPVYARPDHWGAKQTDRSATGYRTELVKRAWEALPYGSVLGIRGRHVTVAFNAIFDEDNPTTSTNRDYGKAIIAEGGRTLRYGSLTQDMGAEIELINGQNTHLFTLTGATRASPTTGSRAGFYTHGVTWRGNKGNQTAGDVIRIVNIKDAEFHCHIEDAKDIGFNVTNSAPASNSLLLNLVEAHGCDGGNIDLRGAADTSFVWLISGPTADVGVKLGSGQTGLGIRAYLADVYNVQATGGETSVSLMRLNDSGDCNLFVSDTATGNKFPRVRAEDGNQNGNASSSPLSANVYIHPSATGTRIGLECDNDGSSAEFDLWNGSTTGFNEVTSYVEVAAAATAPMWSPSGTRSVSNRIAQQKKKLLSSASSVTPIPMRYDRTDFTLNANLTVNNVANNHFVEGQQMCLTFTQDGTGGRTVAFGTNYRVTTTFNTTASTVTILWLEARENRWIEKACITGIAA